VRSERFVLAIVMVVFLTMAFVRAPREVEGRIIDGILLDIAGEGITYSEFRDFVAKRLSLSLGDADVYLRKISSKEKLRPLLEDFIDVMLIRKKLKDLGESVSDEEVSGVIKDIIDSNNLTREQFEKALEGEGLTMEAYRERLREDMEKSRIVRALKGKEVMVTDDEVREYYLANKNRYLRGFEARLTILTIDLKEAREKLGLAELREVLGRVDRAISGGASLEEVKGVLRDEGINFQISRVGPVKDEDLRGEMKGVVEELRPGEVSTSLLVGERIVYVRLDSKEGGVPKAFDEVREEIREDLVNRRSLAAIKKIIKELREEYYIEVRL